MTTDRLGYEGPKRVAADTLARVKAVQAES